MTKQDYIRYWQETSEKDWEAVESLFEKGNYVHALFWAHLVLEKLLKAHWVKDNRDNIPPKIHNLVYLERSTALALSQIEVDFLDEMNDYQLDGRYPDYSGKIYETCTHNFADLQLQKVNHFRQFLLSKLP